MIKMKNISILFFLILAGASCASAPGVNPPASVEKLKAEYHLMKNKLNLAIRENEVVKGENLIQRSEIDQLKEKNNKLKADLDALNQKYEYDMAMMTGEQETLQAQYTHLEEESHAKIQELTAANLKTENKLAEETQRFSETLKTQKETFAIERNAMESGFAEKKLEYEGRQDALTKELTEKEAAFESLTATLAESKAENETVKKTLAEQQTTIETLQKKVDDLLAAIPKMTPAALSPPKPVQEAQPK